MIRRLLAALVIRPLWRLGGWDREYDTRDREA